MASEPAATRAAEPEAAEPTRAEAVRAEPTRAEPTRADAVEPGAAEPTRAEAVRAEPTPAASPTASPPNASGSGEPAQVAPAPARSGADGDHIPEDAELSYATLPADFWGDEGGDEVGVERRAEGGAERGAEGGAELTPSEESAASTRSEPERPKAPDADVAGDEQETEEPLRQAFAELQRLFPGRVIEVVAPPAETAGAFDDASTELPADAPGTYQDDEGNEDDEANQDGNDAPDVKTQPAISFVPSPDEE